MHAHGSFMRIMTPEVAQPVECSSLSMASPGGLLSCAGSHMVRKHSYSA
jgi:hypothetical protein